MQVTGDERQLLISMGLVEARRGSIAPGGQVFLLTAMGRVAARLARLAGMVA